MLIICEYCKNYFNRRVGQYNEAVKMGWKQFCSKDCQAHAKSITSMDYKCYYSACNKSFKRRLSQACIPRHIFCSKKCSAMYYGSLVKKDHSHPCQYPGCENMVLADNNAKKFCSQECLSKFQRSTKYSPENVIRTIRDFYETNGCIPLKYELQALYTVARMHFGTWNKAIIAAGYDPNPVKFAKHYLACDGHKCDSMAEKIVDDYLFLNNVTHRIHVSYPWNNGMKCDFSVGENYIEIFGLEGQHNRYDELKSTKLKLAKKYRLAILKLTLKDVYGGRIKTKLSALTKTLGNIIPVD